MKKTYRIAILPVILVGLFLSQPGCATTEVGKAQQVTHAGAVDFNSFIQFEKANRAQLWKLNPNVKHIADKMRHCQVPGPNCEPNAGRWIQSAIDMVNAYKGSRTPENKANMDTALAVLQEMIDQVTLYFLDPQISSIDPAIAVKYKPTKIVP